MGSALLCITRKNPIACALWLVVTLFALAALFVLLDAQFIGVLQVLVYAGAIMVLFLFVIMLLNLGRPGPTDLKGPAGLGVGVLLAGLLLVQLLGLRQAAPSCSPSGSCDAPRTVVGRVGRVVRAGRRRRAAAAQRHRHFHVRRADAQRRELDVRRARTAARCRGSDLRLLRHGRRR